MRLPHPRGPVSRGEVTEALRGDRPLDVERCWRTWPPPAATCSTTRTCSWRCGSPTSCTTAGSRTSRPRLGVGPRPAAGPRRARGALRGALRARAHPPRGDAALAASRATVAERSSRRRTPPTARRWAGCCSARRPPSSSWRCSSTAASTSSRRPTRTRSRCRGCRAAPRWRSSSCSSTSTAPAAPSGKHATLFGDGLAELGLDAELRRLRRRRARGDARPQQRDAPALPAPPAARCRRRAPRRAGGHQLAAVPQVRPGAPPARPLAGDGDLLRRARGGRRGARAGRHPRDLRGAGRPRARAGRGRQLRGGGVPADGRAARRARARQLPRRGQLARSREVSEAVA